MDGELRTMVMTFRVSDLQALLGFAGKNKNGRKNELQARALELVKSRTAPVVLKLKELYKSYQMTTYGQAMSVSVGGSNSTGDNAASMGSNLGSNARYSTNYYSSDYKQDSGFGRHLSHQRVMGLDGQYRTVPICPDVKMKELPFFDILSVLIRPTTLLNQGQVPRQEIQQSFCLTPSQANEISSSREYLPPDTSPFKMVDQPKIQYNVQVQLRFCAVDTAEEQDDMFPQNLVVKVNGRNVTLPHPIPSNRPGVEPKRPSKPLNITNSVKCSPVVSNTITVQWVAENSKNYALSVYMVKRLTSLDLFQRLKKKNIQQADYTRGRIKEITTSEEEEICAPTSIRVSVACPLGKNRMSYPCRGLACKHLQCFDANLFLMMNEKKPTFICPVCNKQLKFDDLTIDGYFMDVINKLSIDAGNEIELYPDGSWQPAVKVKNELEDVGPPSKRLKSDCSDKVADMTIDLDDDDIKVVEEAPSQRGGSTEKARPSAVEPEVIDLLDSSDEEDNDGASTINCNSNNSSTFVSQTVVNSVTNSAQEDNQADGNDSDDDAPIIRPRRRGAKVNYVEDSSNDSSTADEEDVIKKTNSQQTRPILGSQPACIDLSDDSRTSSPEPPNRSRAFAAVSSQSSSSASSHPNNNRSGSGSSTLYSSATATTMPTTTGVGHLSSSPSLGTVSTPHLLNSSTNSFTFSSSSSSSALLASQGSSLFFSSTSTPTAAVPGYTAFDARTASNWDDLNNLINVQQQIGYGQVNLNMNPFETMHPFGHQSSSYPFGARGPGGASGPRGGSGYGGGWI